MSYKYKTIKGFINHLKELEQVSIGMLKGVDITLKENGITKLEMFMGELSNFIGEISKCNVSEEANK